MVAEIILAPDLSGEPIDNVKSGAQQVARALSAVGVKVLEQISVCSGKRDFQKAIATALKRSNIVVTLGGLYKEDGNATKAAVAQGLGLPLEMDKACFRTIEDYCKRMGYPLLPEDIALAQIPKGSIPLPGKYGKTPGIMISSKYQHIVMLPAAEQEALSILSEEVIPRIQQAPETTVIRTLRTYGVSEEAVRRDLAQLMGESNPLVTVHKDGNEILVRVTAMGSGSEQAAAICTPVLLKAVDLLGDSAYGLDVESLQAAVVDKLKNKNLGLAIAEAGSSGMLNRLISETRDGSDVLRYSVCADDDLAKKEWLGLSGKLLEKKGPVSEETAVAMADAARRKSGADIGASLVMGSGHNSRSPRGLVYIAVCGQDNVYVKKLVIGDGDAGQQDMALDTALSRALNMIRLVVDYHPKWYMGAIPLEEALQGRTVTVTDLILYDSPAKKPPPGPVLAKSFSGSKVRKAIVIAAALALVLSLSYIGVQRWPLHQAQQHAQEIPDTVPYEEVEPVPDTQDEQLDGERPEGLESDINVAPPGTGVSAAGMDLLGLYTPQEAENTQEPEPLADDVPAQADIPPPVTAQEQLAASQQPAPPPPTPTPTPPAPPPQQQPAAAPAQQQQQTGGIVVLAEHPDIPETTIQAANNDTGSNRANESRARTTPHDGTLRVRANGREFTGDALEIVSRIVQIEVGPSFHTEAIKAQAVAAYSFVRYFNDRGDAAGVLLASNVDPRVESIVASVLGEAVYFNGRIAFTPYHAISAGATNSSRDVWGGHYAYLISVNSSACRGAPGFQSRQTFTMDQMEDLIQTRLGIWPGGSVYTWFDIISFTDGGYVRDIRVGGHSNSLISGARITGRYIRENVLNLRSAAFTIEFDSERNRFTVTTFGHGHGVGMPQHGANIRAQQGWSYIQILEHYFPGTVVR